MVQATICGKDRHTITDGEIAAAITHPRADVHVRGDVARGVFAALGHQHATPVAAFQPDEGFAVRIELHVFQAHFCAEHFRADRRRPQPERYRLVAHQSPFSRKYRIISTSPGECPRSVSMTAASARCWVLWLSTCIRMFQATFSKGTPLVF